MAWCKAKCPKWPVTRKCCFCVPIRKGVTIFGYVNLVSVWTFYWYRLPILGWHWHWRQLVVRDERKEKKKKERDGFRWWHNMALYSETSLSIAISSGHKLMISIRLYTSFMVSYVRFPMNFLNKISFDQNQLMSD